MGDTPIMEPPQKWEIYKEPNQYDNMLGIITKIGWFHTRTSLAEYRNKPTALGFTFRFFANELNRNPNIKLLAIDGVAPTVANIQNETYPFITEAYVITAKARTGNVAKLIDFLRSLEGRSMIEKIGYTPYRKAVRSWYWSSVLPEGTKIK